MAITTRNGKTETVLAEINMIPFIDVMLVLLIIFMITAPVIQSGIEVNVPQTKQVRELSKEHLVVTIDANQELYLQSSPVTIREIAPQVKAKLEGVEDKSVYFRADGDVPWRIPIIVMDELKAAGINDIIIVTQPVEKKR